MTLQFGFYINTSITNPGFPKAYYESEIFENNERNFRQCKDCKLWINTEERTFHCQDCGICIEGKINFFKIFFDKLINFNYCYLNYFF